jgi:hypothetical protein
VAGVAGDPKKAAWPDKVYKAGLKAIERDTIEGSRLPDSVWQEVMRRDDEVAVLDTLFSKLTASTRSLQLQQYATGDASKDGVRGWAKQFSVTGNRWHLLINQVGELYDTIQDAQENLLECNDDFATNRSQERYGETPTKGGFLTWLVKSGIPKMVANQLIKMLTSCWFDKNELTCTSMNSIRLDINTFAESLVEHKNFWVTGDGKQQVIFHYVNPVKLLRLVSALNHPALCPQRLMRFPHTHPRRDPPTLSHGCPC